MVGNISFFYETSYMEKFYLLINIFFLTNKYKQENTNDIIYKSIIIIINLLL